MKYTRRKAPAGSDAHIVTRSGIWSLHRDVGHVTLGWSSPLDRRPRLVLAVGLPWEWKGWHAEGDGWRWARGFFALSIPGRLAKETSDAR